jgi:glycogen debranching enzyme
VVEDPAFNAILVAAGEDLARIAAALEEDGARFLEQASRTRAAVERRLWNPALHSYVPFDRVARRQVLSPVAGGFVPLFAGIPSASRAQLMCKQLDSAHFWPQRSGGRWGASDGWPVPTCDRLSPSFVPTRYWRGPAWVNVNWMIARGLRRYRRNDYAEAIEAATLALVRESGFREYFHPLTGEGLGSDRFSWSAALTLDLLRG